MAIKTTFPRATCVTASQFQGFVRHYLIAALWTETDEDDENFDSKGISPEDLPDETLSKAMADCAQFVEQNDTLLKLAFGRYPPRGDSTPVELAAHDFWLTRNGHGVGFWDRGIGVVGDRLSEACRAFRSVDLYRGDDNLIYLG